MVADNLRQVEVCGGLRAGQIAHLPRRVGIRVGPTAKLELLVTLPDSLAKFVGVFDASAHADVTIAAEHDERGKTVLACPVGIVQAVVQRVLARQKRHYPLVRRVRSEVRNQVAQVVFLLGADRAVGQKDEHAPVREAPDGMVGVDPGIHARRGGQLRARRPQFGCNETVT